MKRIPIILPTATMLVGLVVLFANVTAQTSAGGWEPEMQVKVRAVGAPRVSPDGKRIVYTVSEAVTTPEKSEYVTQIWMGDVAAKQNLQITFGDKSSTNPKWSPDGNWIAFTSNRKDNKNNLPRSALFDRLQTLRVTLSSPRFLISLPFKSVVQTRI